MRIKDYLEYNYIKVLKYCIDSSDSWIIYKKVIINTNLKCYNCYSVLDRVNKYLK